MSNKPMQIDPCTNRREFVIEERRDLGSNVGTDLSLKHSAALHSLPALIRYSAFLSCEARGKVGCAIRRSVSSAWSATKSGQADGKIQVHFPLHTRFSLLTRLDSPD